VPVRYFIEVGRPRRPERKRRRRGPLAWITGDPGVRSVEDDLVVPESRPALTPIETLVRGFELLAQSCRVTEVEIREPELGWMHYLWSLTVDEADEILEELGLGLTAGEFYDGKTVPIQLGTALLRAALEQPERDRYLYCGLSAPGLEVWPRWGRVLSVRVDRPGAEITALLEQLDLTVESSSDVSGEINRFEVAPADDAFWTEVAERTDRAGAPLPCGQHWILGVEQWFLVDRANLAEVRAQIRPRAWVMLLNQPLVAPDRELIEQYRQQLREVLHTGRLWRFLGRDAEYERFRSIPHWRYLVRDAEDQRIRSIRPGELSHFEFLEAAIDAGDLVGAYWAESEPVPEDGLIAGQPDPDGVVRTPWLPGPPEQ